MVEFREELRKVLLKESQKKSLLGDSHKKLVEDYTYVKFIGKNVLKIDMENCEINPRTV